MAESSEAAEVAKAQTSTAVAEVEVADPGPAPKHREPTAEEISYATLPGRPPPGEQVAQQQQQPQPAPAADPLMEALRLRNKLRARYFLFDSARVLHRWEGDDSLDGGLPVKKRDEDEDGG